MSAASAAAAPDRAGERGHRSQSAGRRPLRSIAFYGVAAVILVSAVPNGSDEEWQKLLVAAALCVFAIVGTVDGVIHRDFRFAASRLLLPLVAVLALAAVQIANIPGIAGPVSSDPYATLGFAIVFAGLLAAGEILFRTADSQMRILSLIVLVLVIGVASAVYGLYYQQFVAPQPLPAGYQSYAQFVNRNHFAVLMEMVLGLVLGIVLKSGFPPAVKAAGWAIAGFITYSLIAANSRGGLITLGALSVFAVILYAVTRRRRGTSAKGSRSPLFGRIAATAAVCVLVLGIVIVMIAFVGGDRAVTRIEKLKDEVAPVDVSKTNRKLIWLSTVELIKDRPILGSGFGAYSTAITKFDISGGEFRLQQAHNDYLELLAGGGVVGFLLFAVFGLLLAIRLINNLRSQDALVRAAAFGGTVGIFGVLVHNVVDFGLHVMVNALVFAVLIVVATATPAGTTEKLSNPSPRRRAVRSS